MTKVSMDKKYKTRNSFPVRILCVDKKGCIPVLGLMDKGGAEYQMFWVRNCAEDSWTPRHFSHIDNGYIMCWHNGGTSFSSEKGAWVSWRQYSLTNPNA